MLCRVARATPRATVGHHIDARGGACQSLGDARGGACQSLGDVPGGEGGDIVAQEVVLALWICFILGLNPIS